MNREKLFDTFIELMGRFAEIKAVVALRDGFIMTTPFTICGSVFLLIANLPIPGYAQFMASIFGNNWTDPLNQVAGATFSILALICVLTISYKYCEAEGCDAIMGAVMSMSTFLILTASYVISKDGEKVGDVIPKMWAGSNGVITAIIVSFIVSYIFCYCEKNKIGIKMPDSVPSGVVKAFSALVPGLIFFTGAAIIYALCKIAADSTFPELIFKVLQTPLQHLTDTLTGGVIIAGLQSVLFWAGIHGPNVVGGVISPVLTANAIDNQHLLDAGMQLIGNPQAKIITIQVSDVFIKSGGCGLTLGFLIASFISGKSQQLKSISKLSFVPGLFNINEPIIFGLPIVFNPYLLLPFVLVPIIAMIITYISIAVGFMPPFNAVQVPWTTPAIIAGALLNGWQGAFIQVINLVMATAIYFPFVKAQDNAYLKEEQDTGA